nr:retrotransposon protein, putative, unclassified [Tanacetum cinerariifolium]
MAFMDFKCCLGYVIFRHPDLMSTGQAELMMMSIYPNTGLQLMTMEESIQAKVTAKPSLQKVIEEYAEVFEVPNKLPPARSHDHKIPLVPAT